MSAADTQSASSCTYEEDSILRGNFTQRDYSQIDSFSYLSNMQETSRPSTSSVSIFNS